jgi:hypothetical protein
VRGSNITHFKCNDCVSGHYTSSCCCIKLCLSPQIRRLFSWTQSTELLHISEKSITIFFCYFMFIYLVCETIGTAATPGPLCQPRVIVKMIVEKQMECRLAGGNRSSRRKPAPAPLLSITKSHMTRPGFEPVPPRQSLYYYTTATNFIWFNS